MNCQDARDWGSVAVREGIGLTEVVLVEAHVRQCADCRRHLCERPRATDQRLRALQVRARREAESVISVLGRSPGSLRILCTSCMRVTANVTGVARGGSVRTLALAATIGSSLALPFKVAARATIEVIDATRGAIGRAIDLLRRTRSLVGLLVQSSARVTVAVAACRIEALRVAGSRTGPRWAWSGPVKLYGWVAGALLLPAALALYALEQPARQPMAVSSGSGSEANEEVPSSIPFPDPPADQPTVPDEVPIVVPSPSPPPRMTAATGARPDRVASRSASDEPRPSPETTEVSERAATVPDVIGRLVVKNLNTAERALAMLIEEAGGTELGRQRDRASTMLDAAVPRAAYAEFSRGLARIGSWHVEAERSRLPDGVRVTIRLNE